MMATPLSTDTATRLSTQTSKAPRTEIRKDFQQELERKLDGWLGRPGTPEREKVETLVEGMLGKPDANGQRHFDLSKLQEPKLRELVKLQKASEDFEAVFVKGLLSKMRQSSIAEDAGPMGEMARDFMDQAVAESVAKSKSSIGIGKIVFVEMAQRVVSTSDVTNGAATTGEKNGKED